MLSAVCYTLYVICYMLYMLYSIWYLLYAIWYMLYDICYMLYVICYMLYSCSVCCCYCCCCRRIVHVCIKKGMLGQHKQHGQIFLVRTKIRMTSKSDKTWMASTPSKKCNKNIGETFQDKWLSLVAHTAAQHQEWVRQETEMPQVRISELIWAVCTCVSMVMNSSRRDVASKL